MEIPTNTHDLRLPAWGPYTKRYIGISHIPDVRAGPALRPERLSRLLPAPGGRAQRDVGVRLPPLGGRARPALLFPSPRAGVEGSGLCDVSFSQLDEHTAADPLRVRQQHRRRRRTWCCTIMASLQLPLAAGAIRTDPMPPGHRAMLPEGALWVDALDYADHALRPPAPHRQPGPRRPAGAGRCARHGFVSGSGLGAGLRPGRRRHGRLSLRRAAAHRRRRCCSSATRCPQARRPLGPRRAGAGDDHAAPAARALQSRRCPWASWRPASTRSS